MICGRGEGILHFQAIGNIRGVILQISFFLHISNNEADPVNLQVLSFFQYKDTKAAVVICVHNFFQMLVLHNFY